MTDEPTSGNRWEPASAGTPADSAPDAEAAPEQRTQPPGAQEPPSAAAGAGWHRRLTAARTKITAAAAVLFLGAGGAGYAVGHTAADQGGGSTNPGRTSFDRDGDGHRPGFDGHHDGPGVPPGQADSDPGAGAS